MGIWRVGLGGVWCVGLGGVWCVELVRCLVC